MESFRPVLGARVRAARTKTGLSQATLAKKAGLHEMYVSALERGLTNPTVETLISLARVLGVSVADLVSGLEAPEHPRPPARKDTDRRRRPKQP